jgi:hypothetical protein
MPCGFLMYHEGKGTVSLPLLVKLTEQFVSTPSKPTGTLASRRIRNTTLLRSACKNRPEAAGKEGRWLIEIFPCFRHG